MKKHQEKGFTLIEVLISLALVSLLALGALELIVLSVQVTLKASGTMEMTDLASSRLEEGKAAGASPGPFLVVGRRQACFRGEWERQEKEAGLERFAFEIHPELEPEAVIALIILFSRDLGF